MAKREHKTLAKLHIPLKELGEYYANGRNNAWLNLIGSYDKGKPLPKITLVQLNIKTQDGEILKGIIKKADLSKFTKFSDSISREHDDSKTRLNILDKKFFKFMQEKREKEAKKKK